MGTVEPTWLTTVLRDQVHGPIAADPRTTSDTWLGWRRDRIFWDVLGGGQGDFTQSVGHLTPHDRALLYAKYNMQRHLDELGEAFRQLFASSQTVGSPTLIDLGCGPSTTGLALASALGPGHKFRYFGLDRAQAMCELGKKLLDAARDLGALHHATTFTYGMELDATDFGLVRGDLTLVVASYLLASPTIDVQTLVGEIVRAAHRIGPGPVAVLYTNSGLPARNVKFPEFRDALLGAGFELTVDTVEEFTKTRTPAPLRYALFYRPARTEVSIEEIES